MKKIKLTNGKFHLNEEGCPSNIIELSQNKMVLGEGDYLFLTNSLRRLRNNNIFVWDLDKVLYDRKLCITPFHIGESFEKNRLINTESLKTLGIPIKEEDILLTGRSSNQKEQFLSLLNLKGFKFSEVIFRNISDKLKTIFHPFKPKKSYYQYKITNVEKLHKRFDGNIVAVEDHKRLIEEYKKRDIKTIYLNINMTLINHKI